MRDKQSQQRRRRADGPVGSVADGSAVEENRSLASQTAQAPQGWPSVDRQPPCPGRDSVDSAERCSLAGLARGVSASLDLLAAAAGLGGAGRLDESPARGNDARDDPRRSVSSCRASSAETDAGDRRQSLRQRSVARAAGTARNRTDRAASLEPQETGDARWPSAAAVPASLDRRTHQRLARKLPPLGGALRPLAHDISRVLSYRLLHDRLTEGCAIASKHLLARWILGLGDPVLQSLVLLHFALRLRCISFLAVEICQAEMRLRGERGLPLDVDHSGPCFFGRSRVAVE